MRAPYITHAASVNTSLPHNDIEAGSTIRFVRAWREDETPDERNFPVAVVQSVTRTANGFAVYVTDAGRVWYDRVLEVISVPAAVESVLAA